MTDGTKLLFSSASLLRAYDELFVPMIFEPWARLLLVEANLQPGEMVLDLATGPGTVARLAAVHAGTKGHVLATDIAEPMLTIARSKAPLPGSAEIEYLQSPAAPLAAPSATFDAVLCQQGLQYFPDRAAALREMRRVLTPNGRVALAVWAGIDRNPIFAAYHAALKVTAPFEIADMSRIQFSWPDGDVLKATVSDAGFREIRLLTLTLPMVLDEGLDEAVRIFAATPVSPLVAALPQETQDRLFARVRHEMRPLLKDGKIVSEMTSNIVVARC